MAVTGYETYVVLQSDWVTADLIVWWRYRKRALGIVEAMLDVNPQLAVIHRTTPFLPAGTQVLVPIDPAILANNSPVTNPALANMWSGG